jgi:DNA topoisomerase-3
VAKALIITEKPSVARDIASSLGGFEEHDGYFESDGHVLTFAVGHLFELLPPEEIDERFKRWTLDTLPILPETFGYKAKSGQSERIRTIKRLLARDDVDTVINACDAGREGELIFREIVEQLGSGKPIRRLWLQSMTQEAIRRGFTSLRPGEELEGLAAAAECRARSDWLIGMNATRALTKRLKSRKEKTAWSAGRVQTPTLAMLVDREFEILAHVPRSFWRVSVAFDHEGQRYEGSWFDPAFRAGDDEEARDDRLFDEQRAQAIVAAVAGQAGQAGETRKPSRESAPPLFDLTSLQREGNRRFGWSARRTLSAAQRCYERHKLLTYPRTDSRCLPNDYRGVVDEVLRSFAGASADAGEDFSDYAAAAQRLIEVGRENESRVFDDGGVSDHFAIIPTGGFPEAPLTGDDKRLFDLVARRFLGAFHPPAMWERVERVTQVGEEHFRTRARFLKEAGWRLVLPASGEEADEALLPPLASGRDQAEGVGVRNLEAETKAEETKPPARITEARLLSLMENAGKQIEDEDLAAVLHEKGIGTPATRADIIENLIAKGYVVRVGKALRPSVKGIRLIDTLHRIDITRLTSPGLTGEIENHLLEVERGRRKASDFMNEIKEYATAVVDRAKTFEYDELYDANQSLGRCPCGEEDVIEQAWFYRCREKPGVDRETDCPFRMWKDTSGRYLDRQAARNLLRDGTTGVLDGFTARNGRTYKGQIELERGGDPNDRSLWKLKVRSLGWNEEGVSDQPEYDVNPEPLGRCPFEEECSIVESPTHFVCERKLKEEELGVDEERPKSCGLALPRTVCKREITRDEALVYVGGGKTELLTDFTSRFGRPFSAILVLQKNGRHGFEFPPRKARGGSDGESGGGRRRTTKKTTPGAKGTRKKKTGKKTTRKKTTRKKTARKTSSAKADPATSKSSDSARARKDG